MKRGGLTLRRLLSTMELTGDRLDSHRTTETHLPGCDWRCKHHHVVPKRALNSRDLAQQVQVSATAQLTVCLLPKPDHTNATV